MEDPIWNKKFEIKLPPSLWVPPVVLLPFITYQFVYMLTVFDLSSSFLWISRSVLFVLILGLFITYGIRIKLQPRHLEIIEDRIIVGDKEISADQIENMIVQGYFSQVIGIKPHGKRLVPSLLCFKIKGSEEEHTEEIIAWAKQNGIHIKYGRIFRWI